MIDDNDVGNLLMPCSVITMIAKPIGTLAMICGHGLMLGKLVHANQKRPIGSATAPAIMRRRRVSCIRPSAGLGASFVRVVKAMVAQPINTPMRMAMNGRLATPLLMPRSSAKEIG